MSNEKHKKSKVLTNQHKSPPSKQIHFKFGQLIPEAIEYMMTHPENFKEVKIQDSEWVDAEITFPIAGNLFYVRVLEYGDGANVIISNFSKCLCEMFAARKFLVAEERTIIFAVDAPAEAVICLWDTILRVHTEEDFFDESKTC